MTDDTISESYFLDHELGRLCHDQVGRDNDELGIESGYLPNSILSYSPEFCLISPEPSMGNISLAAFEAQVETGFRNFLKYEGDLVLHYCAFHFLCQHTFKYHITDISKGAMKVRMADRERESRYSRWMPILEQEIQAFGKPKIIVIGTEAEKALRKAGYTNIPRVRHFATRLDDWYRGYYLAYLRHAKSDLISPFLQSWPEFVSLLMEKLPVTCPNRVLIGTRASLVSDAGRGRFLYYRDEFLSLSAGT